MIRNQPFGLISLFFVSILTLCLLKPAPVLAAGFFEDFNNGNWTNSGGSCNTGGSPYSQVPVGWSGSNLSGDRCSQRETWTTYPNTNSGYSIKFTNNENVGQAVDTPLSKVYKEVSAVVGATYSVSGYSERYADRSANFAGILFCTSSGSCDESQINWTSIYFLPGQPGYGSWFNFSTSSYTAPANTGVVRAYLAGGINGQTGSSNSDDVWFDNISLNETLPAATPTPANSPPTGTVSTASTTIYVNQPASFTGAASDVNSNLNKIQLWSSPTSAQSWTQIGSTDSFSATGSSSYTASWTPTVTGTYYVTIDAYDTSGAQCSGNPFGIPSGWSNCGAGSYLTITVISPPTPTPYIVINAHDPSGNPANVWGMGYNYSCNGWPMCWTVLSTDISSYTNYAYTVTSDNAGGGIALYSNQILLGITPSPNGPGSSNTAIDICPSGWTCTQPNYNTTWNNYWWTNYPNTGFNTVTFVVATITPTPTPYPAPSISSLKVYNSSSSQVTNNLVGTYKYSGNQNTQSGSNWLNPMTVNLNANAQDGSLDNQNINQYYIAFYDKNGTGIGGVALPSIIDAASGNPVQTLQTLLSGNQSEGFVLKYDATTSTYAVWDPSLAAWSPNLGSPPWNSTGYGIPNGNNTYLVHYQNPSGTPPPATWTVYLYPTFGNKSMFTGGYVVSKYGTSAYSSNISPVTGP